MDISVSANDLFQRLGAHFHATGFTDWCRPGLTEDEIATEESRLGIVLPSEYKQLFRLFNGFDEVRADIRHGEDWFNGFHLHPLGDWRNDEDLSLINEFFYTPSGDLKPEFIGAPTKVSGPAHALIHHPMWIPISTPDAWYSWYADFAPLDGGSIGQIVFVNSPPEFTQVSVIAPNLFQFIEIMLHSLAHEGECTW